MTMIDAMAPYERSLRTRTPLRARYSDGRTLTLEIARWLAPVDDIDTDVLSGVVGPALDIGCGPGRVVAHLAERGVSALGIDISTAAVTLARQRGINVRRADVFDTVQREGHWRTALLLDGNIGIGGDPEALLRRVGALLAPGGHAIVEAHRDFDRDERCAVRLIRAGEHPGAPFSWAFAGALSISRYARGSGFVTRRVWTVRDRTFVHLQRRS